MKRFLSVLFGLFLLLCSHVSYAQDQAEPPDDAPVATVPAEAKMPPPPVSEQNQEEPAEPAGKDPVRDFSAEDLAVQKRMAEEKPQLEKSKRLEFLDRIAQINMAVAAWVGVFLGIIGSGLLFFTLRYTRDAAKATQETLSIAERQQRSYISTSPVFHSDLVRMEMKGNRMARTMNINFEIENIGKTIAHELSMGFLGYDMMGKPLDFFDNYLSDFLEKSEPNVITMLPSEKRFMNCSFFIYEDEVTEKDSIFSPSVIMAVRYKVFGNEDWRYTARQYNILEISSGVTKVFFIKDAATVPKEHITVNDFPFKAATV